MKWSLILFYCQVILSMIIQVCSFKKYGTYYETNDSSTRRIWCVRKSRILRTSSSRILQEMDKIDIRILLDEVITIEDAFYLVGRRDKTERDRQSFEKLMSTVDKSMPVIAMDHQPFELKQADAGVDLLLSGHTHRGQMAPNHIVTRRMYELDWGYAQKVHSTQLFLQASDFGDHRFDWEVDLRLYRWKLRLNRIKGQLITVGPFLFSFSKIICVRLYI